MIRWLSLERAAVVAMVALPAAAAAQQGAVVTGRVTDQSSGRGIPDARVTIVGTALVTGTDANGAFTLRNVPTGTQTVRAVRIGFVEQKQTVQVTGGTPVNVLFTVVPAAIQLQQVVTTATGVQRRVEVGNSIGEIKAAQIVETAPVTSMGDLLTARTPGVQVLGGTMTGAGPRVRIRGSNSLSLNNDPIYIIDGVRMTSSSASGSLGIGGTTLSRVSDINPDEIENIEVVRGPSAATLYGTDAANGVILITTKRGRAGRTAVTFLVENGAVLDKNNYPTAYSLTYGGLQANGLYGECTLTQVSTNTCINPATKLPFTAADLTLRSFNPYNDPQTTPDGIGRRQKYGVQASGGSEALRFFTSLESEHERSPLQVAAFDVARLNATTGIPADQFNPNAIRRISSRANLTAKFSPQFNIALSAGYINSLQSLPQTDNNTTGLASSAYGGPGYKTNTTSTGIPLFGYRAFTPGDIFQEVFQQGVNRFLGNTTGTWTPFSWFSSQAIAGIDYSNIVETDLCRRGQCSDFGTTRLGFKNDFRTSQASYNAKSINTANFRPASFLTSKSTFAAEYLYQLTDENGASASTLAPGTVTVNSGAVPSVDEQTSLARTLGLAVEQQFG
ncbi:MAG: TonB-dependent receptor plug domain-containing protein, partial [Gemmatimonadaceae bacterium]